MPIQNEVITNKAHVYIYEDKAVKNFHDRSRNELEFANLKEVQALFREFKLNGWTYKFVQAFKVTKDEGIVMEKVLGVPMLDDPKFTADNYFHAGVWLGYFHKSTRQKDLVKSFGDFTFDNIFISHESKTITGMDPQMLKNKNYYLDLLLFFSSAIISGLKRKLPYNTDCVNKFVEGYQTYSNFQYNREIYKNTVKKVLEGFKSGAVMKRHGKLRFYAGHFLLGFNLKWHLKKVLKQYK
ncbi:MAG TPA: hypothetical protein VK031_08630 [Tissierellaceae bacterium]|nr:hypothetical protein [Tissierellaceae bacterium]